ncbi:MAG TPA: N-acetyltransferase [Propionibacteriaceae bacterium]|nr:N-acetyltransferase [Propionibacteriaceae bacterium]
MRNTEISILPARRDDLDAIMLLERSGFPAAEQWSERNWRGELLGESRTILIARAQHPVGVISIKTIGELADLHRLVVEPRSRRRGIGTDLVHAGLEAVRQLGAREVILEVPYRNEPAIALYQRLGFEQLSARQDYYGPGQHALILKLYDLQAWPSGIPITTEDV